MAEVINLRLARKQRKRASNAAAADTNRLLHGRTKEQRALAQTERARSERMLDGAKLDDADEGAGR